MHFWGKLRSTSCIILVQQVVARSTQYAHLTQMVAYIDLNDGFIFSVSKQATFLDKACWIH